MPFSSSSGGCSGLHRARFLSGQSLVHDRFDHIYNVANKLSNGNKIANIVKLISV